MDRLISHDSSTTDASVGSSREEQRVVSNPWMAILLPIGIQRPPQNVYQPGWIALPCVCEHPIQCVILSLHLDQKGKGGQTSIPLSAPNWRFMIQPAMPKSSGCGSLLN